MENKLSQKDFELSAKFILKLFDLSYIERWNDHPKPFQITELDKQAHKAIIAYLIGHFEEQRGTALNWNYLIEGIIFEALYRSVLTDIKPQVYHRIMSERKNEVHTYVLKSLGNILELFGEEKFNKYFNSEERIENRIIRAAHFLATYWEFEMIYSMGLRFYGMEEIKKSIEDTIEDYFDLTGVERIFLKKKSFNFVDLVGQLRFQKRWIQSPRIPVTSVLGHMFVVASLAFIISLKKGFCQRRSYNNFFCGLFHDLPEVATRDIVSPIKREVEKLDEVIKKYEREQIENKILPLLPNFIHTEFKYLLGIIDDKTFDEFKNRIFNKIPQGLEEDIPEDKSIDDYSPLDGSLIKTADRIAAYIEATLSIHHGLKSKHLTEGIESVKNILEEEFKELLKIILKELELNKSI